MRLQEKANESTSLRSLRKKEGYQLFLFIIPVLIMYIIFCYMPLWGWTYAFFNYKPGRDLFDCDFVGLKNFTMMFSNPVIRRNIFRSLKNTLGMNALQFLCMPLPMIFAILLNELTSKKFKKVVQTASTLPHFVSWVIIFSLASGLLSTTGLINTLLLELGIIEEPFNVLTTDKHVWLTQTALEQWKGIGWGSIVYFAAIAGIDQEMYEAAMLDGAGRFAKIWYITIPNLMPTFFVLFIMKIGNILTTGIDQFMIFGNAMNMEHIQTFDLYIYNLGLGGGQISPGVAVGMMKMLVALVLFWSANWVSKKVRGSGIA